ncbi:MAG: flavodoxin family protein [Defluviitaleaceae bacterium]|nr:flavodoxin family protein [Defluviitaleaceae bacterium]
MKIFAVNGSPRHKGNTYQMINTLLDAFVDKGFETELFQAGGRMVQGCTHCDYCIESKGTCKFEDWITEVYEKMTKADVIILGSPTYFSNITPEIKGIIDRCGFLNRRDGWKLSRKIGVAVTSVRRAGGMPTLGAMQNFFLINDMIIPGSTYWNMTLSLSEGDYQNDKEGLKTIKRLAENVIWLLDKK